MKTLIPTITTVVLSHLSLSAANIQWDNGGSDSEWNTSENWGGDSIPGSNGADNAILAGGDYAAVTSPVTAPANLTSIVIRTGAELDISADLPNIKNLTLGNNGAAGPTIFHDSGIVTASGSLNIGSSASTTAIYDLSGEATLTLAGDTNIHQDGMLAIAGGHAALTTANLTISDLGTLLFEGDITGITPAEVNGAFTVSSDANLVIDLSYYNSGGGTYELVRFGSNSGLFDSSNITIKGLKNGWSANVDYDSDSLNLTIVPVADAYSKLWFIAAANAGGPDSQPDEIILNTGLGYATLDAAGLSCVRNTDGDDLVYTITWQGSDFDGDQQSDIFSFDVRVEGFSGSTYTYSTTSGESSVTLGASSDVTEIDGNWGVGGDYDIDDGESLRFSVENVSVSAAGYSAIFEGIRSMDTIETNAGYDHKHIRGTGTGLDSGSFQTETDTFSFPPVQSFVVTGAGSNASAREWAIFGLAFDFTIADPLNPVTPSLSDYTDDPTGPGYLDPYPAQSDFSSYPEFSWDTVPRWLAVRDSNGFTEANIQSIANHYQVVMFEKANNQGLADIESGVIHAASQLKAVTPDITTLYYRNTVVHYSGYAANDTYNSDDWSQYSEDENGLRTYSLIRNLYRMYNPSVPELREWWIDSCLSVFEDPVGATVIDGLFLDKVGHGHQPLIDENGAFASDYSNMLYTLKQRMPAGKLLTGNTLRNENTNGDRSMMSIMEGSYMERWTLPNKGSNPEQSTADAISVTIQLMREALSLGKIIMLQSGPIGFTETEGHEDSSFTDPNLFAEGIDFALGVFLIVAEENAYFSYQESVDSNKDDWLWDSSNIEVLNRSLGAPSAAPVKDGYVYSRSYEHAEVWIDLAELRSVILWKTNIGNSTFSGSGASNTDTQYTIESNGNINDYSDNFFFMSQPHYGDGEMIVKIDSVENTNSFAKGGVMFRESLDDDAKNVLLYMRPNGTLRMSYRSSTGGRTQAQPGISLNGTDPKWLKLVRSGDTFTGYASVDKINWSLVNQATLVMDEFPEAGIAATSQDSSETATIEASDFSLE